MLKMIKLNKTNIILVGIFFVYLISCFFVGTYHEPWSDEAQAWLLARDNSVSGLIFNELKYDGHPILWFLILKVAQHFHWAFDNITYLALFFCSIGVYILLFKTKIPMFFKATIPFCYYIFYQYSVIARNHSLVFPILMFLAIIYPQKEKKIWQYSILLILLTSVSLHGYVISFVLFVDFIISLIKKINLKQSLPLFLTGLTFLLTALYMHTPADDSFPAHFVELNSLPTEILSTLSNVFFYVNVTDINSIISAIIPSIFTLYFIYKLVNTICKTRNQKILVYTLNFSFLALLILFYNNDWHFGYQFLIVIFSLVAMCQTNDIEAIEFKTNKIFYICFAIILATHIYWSVKSSILDRFLIFDPGKNVAQYIKTNNLKTDKKILGINFQTISVNPYFEKNIFSNTPKSYWYWRKDTIDNNIHFAEKPILIIDMTGLDFLINTKTLEYIEKNYMTINFHGVLISKGNFKEDLSLVLAVPKDVNIKK